MALTSRQPKRVDRSGAVSVITSLTTISPLRTGVDPREARHLLSALPVNVHSPFAASPRTHFARLQVLDELMGHERRPLAGAVLILSADVDGDARSYLIEVLTSSATALAPVLGLCRDAPDDPTAPDFATAAAAYLLARRVPVGLQYANSPGRSAEDVRRAVARHRRLAAFALAHQGDAPEVLRAAFAEAFPARSDVHR